ncbi:MAG: hypothetical protein Q7V63_09605 [Gammaproteobacteria bacterium]|nr:hypothetical protein [Gammaproteobacteria bacterium]
MAWATTEIYDELVKMLNPYRTRDWDALHTDEIAAEMVLYTVPRDGSEFIITQLKYEPIA